ncbi:hypothetical protein NDU88_002397 [Pleurodeles waltl]|uniref:Reverse transcriptase domain-containing protein n=1 Tax=Pleurodeles waltl TaxID=8319 RepID=A0AAV7VZ86_PLEWA|nr:hypothetical protein NDU88_002397 [Pleurodeles waltl]
MYQATLGAGTLTPDIRLAHTALIYKTGKTLEDSAAYQPISILNIELKLLARVFAARLYEVCDKLIHRDQHGFMLLHGTRHNLRCLCGIPTRKFSIGEPVVILFLDAEKASNSLEWPYLMVVLENMELSWISLLYTAPIVKVWVNRTFLREFWPVRGTRQWCPLSPLLFMLAIKPLAEWARKVALLQGIIGILIEKM